MIYTFIYCCPKIGFSTFRWDHDRNKVYMGESMFNFHRCSHLAQLCPWRRPRRGRRRCSSLSCHPSTGDHSDDALSPWPFQQQGPALGAAAATASPAILAQATTVLRAAASIGAERLCRHDGLEVSFRERMSGPLPASALLHTMHHDLACCRPCRRRSSCSS